MADPDAPDLLAELSDPAVVEWLDLEPLASLDEAVAIVTWAQAQRERGVGLRWAVRRLQDRAFAGTCGFERLAVGPMPTGEIAFDLGTAWQGQGVMSAVLPEVFAWGRDRLGLIRFEARVAVGNQRSQALLERQGFRRERVLADVGVWKGRRIDLALYALTP